MSDENIRLIQKGLAGLNYTPISQDGLYGPQTRTRTEEWMKAGGKPKTVSAQVSGAPRFNPVTRAKANEVFGAAGGPLATAGRCKLPIPFVLAWAPNQKVSSFSCHQLLSDHFTWVHEEALRHYGEKRFIELELDQWGGCFNHRNVRNGSLISIHSYGAANDTNPAKNGNLTKTADAQLSKTDFNDWWKIVEATGALSFGKRHGRDWMHWSYVQE
jgi:hypothetical protein